MAENKNIEVGGRLHSIATGNVLVGADEIFDDDKNKKQSQINTETYSLVNDINERLNGLSPDQQSALSVATKATNNEAKLSYYVCETAAATAAKAISATGYILSLGGSIKIKMTNVNTADNATLNINSTGAKALYYAGERASANNTWEAGETVEVYYDGTSYYANSVAGSMVTSEKISSSAFDSTLSVSGKIAPADVVGAKLNELEGKTEQLANVETLKNVALPASPKNLNRYYNENLTWSTDVEGINLFELDIANLKGYTLKIRINNSALSLNKKYIPWLLLESTNNTSYIEGYIGRAVDFLYDGDIVAYVTIPENANYLRFCSTTNNASNVSIVVCNDLKSDIAYVKSKVYDGSFPHIEKLSSYRQINGAISTNRFVTSGAASGQHIVVPICGTHSVKVTANKSFGTYIFVLKDYFEPDDAISHPIFASSYDARVVVNKGETIELNTPDDTKYICIQTNNTAGANLLPSSLIIDGYEYATSEGEKFSEVITKMNTLIENASSNSSKVAAIEKFMADGLYIRDAFLNLDENDGWITGSSSVLFNGGKHKAVRIQGNSWIKIKANVGKYTYCMFVKDYEKPTQEKNHLELTSWGSYRATIISNREVDLYAPKDAGYLLVSTKDSSGIDVSPQKLLINGIDYFKPLINSIEDKELSINVLSAYVNQRSDDTMVKYFNGILFQDSLETFASYAETNVSNHDGNIVITDGVLYLVRTRDVSNKDNASSATSTIRLTAYNIATKSVVYDIVVAKNGDVHGDCVQTGGSGSSSIVLVNNIIHIYYSANINNEYVEIHCEFNTADNTLSNYSRVNISYMNAVNGVLNNSTLYSMFGLGTSENGTFNHAQANCNIASDSNGTYYIGFTFGNGNATSFIAKTTDFVNWEYVNQVNFGFTPIYELALYCEGNNLFLAQRTTNSQFGYLAKYNLSTNTYTEISKIPNCSTRPCFFKVDNELYLMTCSSGTYGDARSRGVLINVDKNNTLNSVVIAEPYSYMFNYPCALYNDGKVYVCSTKNHGIIETFVLHSIGRFDVQRYMKKLIAL